MSAFWKRKSPSDDIAEQLDAMHDKRRQNEALNQDPTYNENYAADTGYYTSNERVRTVESDIGGQAFEKLERTTKLSKLLDTLGRFYLLWALIIPRPATLLVVIGVVLGIVGTLVYIKNSSIAARVAGEGNGAHGIGFSMYGPAAGLLLVVMRNYRFFYTTGLWIAVAAVGLVLSALVLLLSRGYVKKKSMIFLIPLVMLVFSYGAIIGTNCALDPNEPQEQVARVNYKSVSDGNYALDVTLEGGEKKVTVYVEELFYNTTRINDKVVLYLQPGLWGIEWVL